MTVDSGQKQATGTWVSGGGFVLVLGKLGGGAGREQRGIWRFRFNYEEQDSSPDTRAAAGPLDL